MSDAQALAVFGIVAPMAILGIIGMVRGYHLHLKVWKGDRRDDNSDR